MMHYYFWGMHSIWWVVWIIFLIWVFVFPYGVSGQRRKKSTPLDILKKRFASGELTKEEYLERKKIIENNNANK